MGVDPFDEAAVCNAFYGYEEGSDGYAAVHQFAVTVKNWLFKHWENGHIVPGYGMLLREGYGAILKECDEAMQTADPTQRQFIRAMRIVC